jgi:hypothetical protein
MTTPLNIHFKHASGIAVQNRSVVEAIRRFGAHFRRDGCSFGIGRERF